MALSEHDKPQHPDQEVTDIKHEKTDPGTTHSTDPQKNMEGPLSSLVHKLGESLDDKKLNKKDDDK